MPSLAHIPNPVGARPGLRPRDPPQLPIPDHVPIHIGSNADWLLLPKNYFVNVGILTIAWDALVSVASPD